MEELAREAPDNGVCVIVKNFATTEDPIHIIDGHYENNVASMFSEGSNREALLEMALIAIVPVFLELASRDSEQLPNVDNPHKVRA